MSAALWRGFAVVQLEKDGTPLRTSPKWTGDTEEKAIRAYEKASTTHNYAFHRETGYARVRRIQLLVGL
jgi:hypothetical protein